MEEETEGEVGRVEEVLESTPTSSSSSVLLLFTFSSSSPLSSSSSSMRGSEPSHDAALCSVDRTNSYSRR